MSASGGLSSVPSHYHPVTKGIFPQTAFTVALSANLRRRLETTQLFSHAVGWGSNTETHNVGK